MVTFSPTHQLTILHKFQLCKKSVQLGIIMALPLALPLGLPLALPGNLPRFGCTSSSLLPKNMSCCLLTTNNKCWKYNKNDSLIHIFTTFCFLYYRFVFIHVQFHENIHLLSLLLAAPYTENSSSLLSSTSKSLPSSSIVSKI